MQAGTAIVGSVAPVVPDVLSAQAEDDVPTAVRGVGLDLSVALAAPIVPVVPVALAVPVDHRSVDAFAPFY